MFFKDSIAHTSVQNFLQDTIVEERISHAQLFIGKPGYGTLATALEYAKMVICAENEQCQKQVSNFNHPDLHFSIPTFNLGSRKAMTKEYFPEFRTVLTENKYLTLNDWLESLDAGNKQAILSKDEILEVSHAISLKSFAGGYKVLIIWNADKMNDAYANKFLKLLEEPPEKTLFILITEKEEDLISTIYSRCQTVYFKPIEAEKIQEKLIQEKDISKENAAKITKLSHGDYSKALQLAFRNEHDSLFEQEFKDWTRNAFMVKTKIVHLQHLIKQAEKISGWQKEAQKQYLQYCIENFRQALLLNYNNTELVENPIQDNKFNFQKFATYITGKNIENILEELNKTYYHLERNANSKLSFINLGLKLTRFIHKN